MNLTSGLPFYVFHSQQACLRTSTDKPSAVSFSPLLMTQDDIQQVFSPPHIHHHLSSRVLINKHEMLVPQEDEVFVTAAINILIIT
ncbi:hypothetical protein [Halomonas huangheensis]|uniref:hypothetical protein n=1 Tax=Halomonas huangheensis TaxID=1178482 RepID=UPI0012DCEE3F|nr:hypothetical protein [Halomonas huangheensis]